VILGIGVDLVEVSRIGKSIAAHGDHFTHRIFTVAECVYSESKANSNERFAARFAAKEAAMKALGTGLANGISWTEIEVANHESGQPFIRLHGVAAEVAASLGVRHIFVSLTHTSLTASATVILED